MKTAAIGLLMAVLASAQPSSPALALEEIFSDHEVILLNPGDIKRQVREFNEPLAIELAGARFVFEMEPRDLRSDRYRAEATGEDGLRRQLPLDEVNTYKGTAVGAAHIQGRFTITEDSFDGVVFTPGDWLYIEPVSNYLPGADPAEMVAYPQSAVTHDVGSSCGLSSLHHFLDEGAPKIKVPTARATDYTTLYTAEVATEADYEFVREFRNVSGANRKILSILNRVEGVYEDELRMKLEVTYQHGWATRDDPYGGSTDLRDLIDQFRGYWNDNFFHEDYDLAHLWTARSSLDGGGIAARGVTCRTRRSSYGVSKYYPDAPSSVSYILAAHEIGHNFGADHPDEEDPPITSCRATIMQSGWDPFPDFAFCRFSRTEIREHVTDWCLEAPPPPPPPPPVTLHAPTNLTGEAIGAALIRLRWQDNATSERGFGIMRRSSRPGSWDRISWAVANRTAFVDSDLKPSTTYDYRVYAYDSNKRSSDSNIATLTTLPERWGIDGGGCGSITTLLDTTFSLRAVKAPTFWSGNPQLKVMVPADATSLLVELRSLTPDTDVDLHVNHGSYPKLVDGSPVADHSADSESGVEVIEVTPQSDPPLRAGTYYFAVSLFTLGKQVRTNITARLR